MYLCPSYRRSLEPSEENIQLCKYEIYINFFLCLWVIFGLLDPGSDCESASRYGSRDPRVESGSTAMVKSMRKM
jgi:hypothetical protein